jgi:hypothetical protein
MSNRTNLFRCAALAGAAFVATMLLPTAGSAQAPGGYYGSGEPWRPWQPGYDPAAAPRPDFPGAKQTEYYTPRHYHKHKTTASK